MRLRRRHSAWLILLGALVGMAIISPAYLAENLSDGMALVALFLAALATSFMEIQPRKLLRQAASAPLLNRKISAQAREASERARRRSTLSAPGLTLLDVGLISHRASSEGMDMRRTRSISLDEDGVRPYITLDVQPSEADRHTIVRFEIIDQNGQTQYVHEMKTYLRDGEMNLLADHQLPLYGNERLMSAGEWDLRVSVDGALIGLLGFTASPSLRERARQFARHSDLPAAERLSDEAADSPVSLQDLLRESRQRRDR